MTQAVTNEPGHEDSAAIAVVLNAAEKVWSVSLTWYHARRRARRGPRAARMGFGRADPTVHSCAKNVQRQCITSAPRSRVILATLIQTDLAAHSGQGGFTGDSCGS